MNLYLWFQGFDEAPNIVKWCVHSWKKYNPTWRIVLLDNTNLHEYVDLSKLSYDKDIQLCHLANMVRMILLRDHGGLWIDATAFCNKPLDDWLPAYTHSGFFAFDKPLSTWFLYAEKGHPLITQWCQETLYLQGKTFAQLFDHLYHTDVIFQHAWDQVPKLSGAIPHTMMIPDFFKTTGRKDIDSKRVPVYKLSYKCEFPPYDPRMNVYYLYSTL
jgi:hypothetical protein